MAATNFTFDVFPTQYAQQQEVEKDLLIAQEEERLRSALETNRAESQKNR